MFVVAWGPHCMLEAYYKQTMLCSMFLRHSVVPKRQQMLSIVCVEYAFNTQCGPQATQIVKHITNTRCFVVCF